MTRSDSIAARIIRSRLELVSGLGQLARGKQEAEGGCGVIGIASSIPIAGRHLLRPLRQMHNRGNGKGGGIAAVGLCPDQLGVTRDILERDYLIQVAYLDPASRDEVEREFLYSVMDVHHRQQIPSLKDHRAVAGLEVRPPEVWRYFCRVRADVLDDFIRANSLEKMERSRAEDEFVYRSTFRLNRKFYASLGEKRAFVLSHAKNMIVLKIVGYAEQLIEYYRLEDFKAHIWIGHQRYPTKGRIWHPGGAHPFIGLHEALVHNGDFANYHSVSEYLRQRNIYPLFLTDTEVAVLLFDLWSRVYGYPLEYVIEALAPTTERDFYMLPEEKRRIYKAIQTTHVHGSPDGPWFFIVARNDPYAKAIQLLGITDTSMLRPQVFALQEGDVQIGLVASERQAIDAALQSLAAEDNRFSAGADVYWNARGGSHTDGGAFIFTLTEDPEAPQQRVRLVCTDKFGREIHAPTPGPSEKTMMSVWRIVEEPEAAPLEASLSAFAPLRNGGGVEDIGSFCDVVVDGIERGSMPLTLGIGVLTRLLDRRHRLPYAKRGSVRSAIEESLYEMLRSAPRASGGGGFRLVDWSSRSGLDSPRGNVETLLIDVCDFPSEGSDSASAAIVHAYRKGWRRVVAFDWRGQRFCACGLGSDSSGFRLDVYGNVGDYLASGLDGAEVYVHGSAQDQVAQIMKVGKLVVYGDVGQTFMYGAKGGEVYVLGNAAGRPLINAVGCPRVVINGTCLDYLAESFMAGDPLNGGGFVILNGVAFDNEGSVEDLQTPYPGSNLFSLASGGAVYIRDPRKLVGDDQLNGGRFSGLSQADWEVIRPYLEENQRLFEIAIESDLLTVSGSRRRPEEVYRKVEAVPLKALIVAHD